MFKIIRKIKLEKHDTKRVLEKIEIDTKFEKKSRPATKKTKGSK